MKTLLTNIFLAASVCGAVAETDSGVDGIPWTPVNLTKDAVTVSVVDGDGKETGSFVVPPGRNGTLWVPIPAGGGLKFGGEVLDLDPSGTNANYTVLAKDKADGVIMTLITNAPGVSSDGWPQVNWEWFWAGFGMFGSFFGFTWALRFTKQIGRVNPEP
jgi:hypothetical protein